MRPMTADATWLESMPEVYDRCLGPALFEPYTHRVAALVAHRTPRTVLGLAAGTGILTRELLCALPRTVVTAPYLNQAMVWWAAGRAPVRNLAARRRTATRFPGRIVRPRRM